MEESADFVLNLRTFPTSIHAVTYMHGFRLRFIRVIDLGTKLKKKVEKRNQKIIKQAEPLPKGNCLSGRAFYWFVTTEKTDFVFDDKSVEWKEKVDVTDEHGVGHYLNQIQFRKNKGRLEIRFQNGDLEIINCFNPKPKATNPNKRAKRSPAVVEHNGHINAVQQDEELHTEDLIDH